MNRQLESEVRAWLTQVEATIRTLDPQLESDAARLSAFDDQLQTQLVSPDGFIRARIWDVRHQILRRNALKSSGWQHAALDWAKRACQELDHCGPIGEDCQGDATGIRIRWATANLALDDIAPASRDRLSAAITALRLALPNTAGEARAIALTNYAIALTRRRNSPWAELNDLTAAVDAAQEAVDLTNDDNPQAGSRHLNLGATLRQRYADTGVIGDLAAAVERAEWVIDHLSVPPHHQAMILNNIGQGRRELFEVTADRRHLRSAIRSLRRAETAARRWSAAVLPRTLVSLSIAIREQGSSAAAHRALTVCREALALTPTESSEWAGRRGTLANCLVTASQASSGTQASRLALEARDAVADACNGDSPTMATWLSLRADINVRLFELTNDPAHRAAAVADLETSLDAALAGSPLIGLDVAGKLAQLSLDMDDLSGAETALRCGCQLLRELVPRQWLRQDQRDWHRHAADLTGLYAVVAVRLGRSAEDVIDMIETFRGIEELAIAGALQGAHPELEATIRLSTRNWLRGESASPDLQLEILRRLTEARPMRGCSGLAHVYVIESAIGGVILSRTAAEGGLAVLLPQLTSRRVQARLRVFDQAYRRRDVDRGRWEAEARAIGRWITRNIFAPTDSALPRMPITLVPCGRLSALPWSTARGDPRLWNLGWSERPTTLRTSAGRPMTSIPSLDRGVAVVIAADTPRAIEFETAVVSRLCSPRVLGEATGPDALLAMVDADFIYVAAHGASCDEDAAQSAILLRAERLTAAEISGTRLPRAPIVFLASCDTGRPDANLPNQTFGLIHAFLLAGASVVVAPTYAVSRLGALLMAMAFCDVLKASPHPADPAEAFRQATTMLTKTTNREKAAWVRQYLQPDNTNLDDLCSWLESWPPEGLQLASATGWGMFALHR